MKKMNKKGFTIVELVIVIAVIAILAAVLIPTFSGVVSKANTSAALQEATSTMKSTLAMSDYGTISEGTYFIVDSFDSTGYQFIYTNNKIEEKANTTKFTYTTSGTNVNYYNSIIVNKDAIDGATWKNEDVQKIVEAAIGSGTLATATTGSLYSYTYKVDSVTWNVYTNSDYAKDVVTVTYSK